MENCRKNITEMELRTEVTFTSILFGMFIINGALSRSSDVSMPCAEHCQCSEVEIQENDLFRIKMECRKTNTLTDIPRIYPLNNTITEYVDEL